MVGILGLATAPRVATAIIKKVLHSLSQTLLYLVTIALNRWCELALRCDSCTALREVTQCIVRILPHGRFGSAIRSGVTSGWQLFISIDTNIFQCITFGVVCSLPSRSTLVYSTPWDSLVCGPAPQVYLWFFVTRVTIRTVLSSES
jgi:hypothetical protein